MKLHRGCVHQHELGNMPPCPICAAAEQRGFERGVKAMREATSKFLSELFAEGWNDGCGCCANEYLDKETEAVVESLARLDAIRGEAQ